MTEKRSGSGTRFRETRRMGRREYTTELNVTEYESPTHVRMVSRAGGTIWDTVFRFRDLGNDQTELHLVMDAKAKNPLAALMNFLIKRTLKKAIENDLESVRSHFANTNDAYRRHQAERRVR